MPYLLHRLMDERRSPIAQIGRRELRCSRPKFTRRRRPPGLVVGSKLVRLPCVRARGRMIVCVVGLRLKECKFRSAETAEMHGRLVKLSAVLAGDHTHTRSGTVHTNIADMYSIVEEAISAAATIVVASPSNNSVS